MNYGTKFIHIVLLVFLINADLVIAQEPLTHLHGKGRQAFSVNSWFMIKQSPISIYDSSLSSSVKTKKKKPLGTIYYAKSLDNGRLLLAQYDSLSGWKDELGWVSEKDVAKNLFNPRSIAETISEGVLTQEQYEAALEIGGLANNGDFFLKVISKPSTEVKVVEQPGGPSISSLDGSIWYNVFEFTRYNGKLWALLGKNSQILPSRISKDTSNQSAVGLLLGWVPADELTLYTSNLALELNTSKASVEYRVSNELPATIFEKQNNKLDIIYQEPLNQFWSESTRKNTNITDVIDYDPVGVSTDVPRQLVISKVGEDIEVAGIGSVENGLYDVDTLKQQVNSVTRAVSQLDITFVIDATRGMSKEIKVVEKFISELTSQIQSKADNEKPVNIKVGSEKIDLNVKQDISISLVGYQDIKKRRLFYNTKVYFRNKHIVRDAKLIADSFVRLKRDLTGIKEAIHDGVKRAFKEDMWRKNATERIVILIADEPGNSNDSKGVLRVMPTYNAQQLLSIPALSAFSEVNKKKSFTKVISVFTGEQRLLSYFKSNVKKFSKEIHHINEVNHPWGMNSLKNLLHSIISVEKDNLKKLVELFGDIAAAENPDNMSRLATFPLKTQLAFTHALNDSGLDIESLQESAKQGYVGGYVPINQAQSILEQEISEKKAYRLRALLTKRSLNTLQETTKKISFYLNKSIDSIYSGRYEKFDVLDQFNKKLHIAELLLLVRDQVSGTNKYEYDQAQLELHVARLVSMIESPEWENRTLAKLMSLPRSIPIKKAGGLSLKLTEVLDLHPSQILILAKEMHKQAVGLERISNNVTVPEDYNLVLDDENKEERNWVFTNGSQSTVKYVYVPIAYIP